MNENTRHKNLAAATEHVWDAFVIVVGMLKGGTGKTTSAWFIALYYAVVLGLPTLLLDADATSQSAYDWFKVAQAAGFEIPENLVVERYPFDDIAEYIRVKRAEFGAIVVDAGGGSARIFHEAVTEANLLLAPVAPTKIERRKLVATFDEADRAAARNEHGVTALVVMVKADDRTSLPRNAKDQLHPSPTWPRPPWTSTSPAANSPASGRSSPRSPLPRRTCFKPANCVRNTPPNSAGP
ncbi:ParA family protein [Streptomyces sp. 900105755]